MKNIMYTDQTGKFPLVSSQGNHYNMVLCKWNGNLILIEPTQTSGEMCRAYNKLMQWLQHSELKVKKQSQQWSIDKFLKKILHHGIEHKKVAPNIHRQNLAKKAIGTFKDNFKEILVGVDKTIPIHLWDGLLPQAEATLNMLRTTNIAPTISAYAYM